MPGTKRSMLLANAESGGIDEVEQAAKKRIMARSFDVVYLLVLGRRIYLHACICVIDMFCCGVLTDRKIHQGSGSAASARSSEDGTWSATTTEKDMEKAVAATQANEKKRKAALADVEKKFKDNFDDDGADDGFDVLQSLFGDDGFAPAKNKSSKAKPKPKRHQSKGSVQPQSLSAAVDEGGSQNSRDDVDGLGWRLRAKKKQRLQVVQGQLQRAKDVLDLIESDETAKGVKSSQCKKAVESLQKIKDSDFLEKFFKSPNGRLTDEGTQLLKQIQTTISRLGVAEQVVECHAALDMDEEERSLEQGDAASAHIVQALAAEAKNVGLKITASLATTLFCGVVINAVKADDWSTVAHMCNQLSQPTPLVPVTVLVFQDSLYVGCGCCSCLLLSVSVQELLFLFAVSQPTYKDSFPHANAKVDLVKSMVYEVLFLCCRAHGEFQRIECFERSFRDRVKVC